MAKSLNVVTLVALVVAATLLGHTSAATYVVGDTEGWTFPPNATAYATWASQYTFRVGDVLVFNFVTGSHTVATVTKQSFDSCNIRNPIALSTNGPASITLTSAGETYFICTVGQHCAAASQKLAINVTASSASPSLSPPVPSIAPRRSPVGRPSSPPSASPPSSPPSASPPSSPPSASPPSSPPSASPPSSPPASLPSPATTHIVGGSSGWTLNPTGTLYSTWASTQNFTVGDILVFNFVTGSHDVATVTKESYDTCNKDSPIALTTVGPASITLTSTGETYFICTIAQHCASASQKLVINVTAPSAPPAGSTPSAPPAGSTPSPPPAGSTPSAPPPSTAARTGLVSIFTIIISAAVYLLF